MPTARGSAWRPRARSLAPPAEEEGEERERWERALSLASRRHGGREAERSHNIIMKNHMYSPFNL